MSQTVKKWAGQKGSSLSGPEHKLYGIGSFKYDGMSLGLYIKEKQGPSDYASYRIDVSKV